MVPDAVPQTYDEQFQKGILLPLVYVHWRSQRGAVDHTSQTSRIVALDLVCFQHVHTTARLIWSTSGQVGLQ